MGAVKHDSEKPPLALLSTYALTETARVLEYGAAEYGADNWRSSFAYRRLLSAALRHLFAFSDGEDDDPESGLSHLAHALCMVSFLLENTQTHPELDDRYKAVRKWTPPSPYCLICKQQIVGTYVSGDGTLWFSCMGCGRSYSRSVPDAPPKTAPTNYCKGCNAPLGSVVIPGIKRNYCAMCWHGLS